MTMTIKNVSIEDVLVNCEVGQKTAMAQNFRFFLQTNEDRIKFINEFESRMLFNNDNKPLLSIALAKEIGAYHYEYSTYEELVKLPVKDTLQRLFKQPVEGFVLNAIERDNITLHDLYRAKQEDPSMNIVHALSFITPKKITDDITLANTLKIADNKFDVPDITIGKSYHCELDHNGENFIYDDAGVKLYCIDTLCNVTMYI
ncbi:hypothetical protein [Paenibacillus sp. FSL R5-0912]|uniref:hypothetical protein n=1 Tax=Paenibacillus sp. FSL R5-0912 TaxID=1536771 RepID=UPI0004F674FB|nr:hypothetical protein [Paenibacillus sp. FSL R5-0912]AIQ41096.1 hypothetical protein R50912_14500 [Paenibacillus sp. FSL R5-0912]